VTPDRKARNEIGEAILAYMRLEIRSNACLQKLVRVKVADKGLRHVRLVLCDCCDSDVDHTVSVSREGWDTLRRALAFLGTDLRIEPVRWRTWHWRQWLAAAGLVVLSAAAVASYGTGWWSILILTWVALGTGWVALWPYPTSSEEFRKRLEFWPFRSEAEWKACEPHLDAAALPLYDPVLHRSPIQSKGDEAAQQWLARLGLAHIAFLPITLLAGLRRPHATAYLTAPRDSAH
jgi:hypothetical protein